ncbi:putative TMhelix containing protein [Vibrio phage 249E41-1]|nr:putative TMhelix containing protein [Vibrio phage 249E41-1]CAH9017522.1 putative TMhelix containing protein [Vibrio phage 193E37-1]
MDNDLQQWIEASNYRLSRQNLPLESLSAPKDVMYWTRTVREETFQDEILKWKLKEQSFHWYEFGIGLAVSSLFWGIMFKLFGGS